MKRILLICTITFIIILIVFFTLVIMRKRDDSIVQNEHQMFQAHSQKHCQLTMLIALLKSIDGEYGITIDNGEITFESTQKREELANNDQIVLESIEKACLDLFGTEVSIRKVIDESSTIIVISKTYDVSRNPFKQSWISVSMWYCDDQYSQVIRRQIQLYGEKMNWLDEHYALVTCGMV